MSWPVSGSPSLQVASSLIVKVQVRPSLLRVQSVASPGIGDMSPGAQRSRVS